MKTPLLFILLLFSFAQFSFAQVITFDKTFDGLFQDNLTDVVQTSDGGYAAIGSTREFSLSPSTANIYIRRYDQYGDTLWTKAIGGANWMGPGSIQQTSDGGFIICGKDSYAAQQAYIARLNSTGTILWERWLGNGNINGNAWFSSAKQNADGTFTAVGSLVRSNSADSSMYVYLVKMSALGYTIWEKTFKRNTIGRGLHVGEELVLTSDGGYFITGRVAGQINYEAYLIKTDSLGIQQWTKYYPQTNSFSGKQTIDGGYIIAGNANTVNPKLQRICLYKLNALGDTTWTRKYPGRGVNSVIQTSDGGYAFTGAIIGDSVNYPGWPYPFYYMNLLAGKTDPNGNLRFIRTYGDSIDDAGYSIKETADGGFVIAGVKDWIYAVGVGPLQSGPCKGLLLKINFTAQDAVLSVPKEIKEEVTFQLFPNPATTQTTIRISDKMFDAAPLRIRITNTLGAEVDSRILTSAETVLNRGNLAAGLYLIQVLNNETGKVLVSKKLLLK